MNVIHGVRGNRVCVFVLVLSVTATEHVCLTANEALPFRSLGSEAPAWQTSCALARPHGTFASRRQHALRQQNNAKIAATQRSPAMHATHGASARRRERRTTRHNMTIQSSQYDNMLQQLCRCNCRPPGRANAVGIDVASSGSLICSSEAMRK